MTGRNRTTLAAVLAAFVALSVPSPSIAQSDGSNDPFAHLDDDEDEVVIDATTATNVGPAPIGAGDVVTQVELVPACPGNHPDNWADEPDGLCLLAVEVCPPTPDDSSQVLMLRWVREFDAASNLAVTDWAPTWTVCLTFDQVEAPNLPLLVLREFQDRTKLLAATVRIQPPAGRTLINLDTIFYTDDPSTTIYDIPIAGASVDLQITAAGFRWDFGDGADATSDTAGRPYPEQEVTHRYTSTDTLTARVDVTYTGRYRVDAGTWLDIPGTATVTGTGVDLTIVAAHSELVAGIASG